MNTALTDLWASEDLQSNGLMNTLERIRTILEENGLPWFDILQTTNHIYISSFHEPNKDHFHFLENLASFIDSPVSTILSGSVDFKSLALRFSNNPHLPQEYALAAYGRVRTPSSSIDYLEQKKGWKFRADLLRYMKVRETLFFDPFARISIRFISEFCELLSRIGFTAEDFFKMGFYSYSANQNSLLAQAYSMTSHPMELYATIFEQNISLYENNCSYSFKKLTPWDAWLEVRSKPEVAEEMGLKNLGNRHICQLKAGFIACAPLYLGLPSAQVTESSCVHRGDDVCLFKICYENASREHSERITK